MSSEEVLPRIIVLDYGSQFSQLIVRRIREAQVYCEMVSWDTPAEKVMSLNPKGFVLSGSHASVYDEEAPTLPSYLSESRLPIFGICYGMQLLARTLGGRVEPSSSREYGFAELKLDVSKHSGLYDGGIISPYKHSLRVWMSHGDRVVDLPPGFVATATTSHSPIAMMSNHTMKIYAAQFHPEVSHTECGSEMLWRFARVVCGMLPTWTSDNIIDESLKTIRARVGTQKVVCGLSGGVDSAVAASLIYKAIGDQLTCIFVDTGLLRLGEAQQVVETFGKSGAKLIHTDASTEILEALSGVTDPEEKRKIIGEKFIRIFERVYALVGAGSESEVPFLAQGTLYPDVIESRGPERSSAAKIKTHHNVGGLPKDMKFQLLEPLRYLFKDEVRTMGKGLGLPDEIVYRQPFPGPGLAVRCLGEITPKRLEVLRHADSIFQDELKKAGLIIPDPRTGKTKISQSFVVLLPVRTVGVMGDGRTYDEVAALRAVETDDFMTADWVRIPFDVLERVSNRIVNEVKGISRVVYDITTKPPATIEWE
jgi:GMP synthase (glutamine-hydrolysing)